MRILRDATESCHLYKLNVVADRPLTSHKGMAGSAARQQVGLRIQVKCSSAVSLVFFISLVSGHQKNISSVDIYLRSQLNSKCYIDPAPPSHLAWQLARLVWCLK